MPTISLKLPEDLLAELNREAKAKKVSKSAIVRRSLELLLHGSGAQKEVSAYDLAHDLAGLVKGMPKDLATNPKYMDGFGE